MPAVALGTPELSARKQSTCEEALSSPTPPRKRALEGWGASRNAKIQATRRRGGADSPGNPFADRQRGAPRKFSVVGKRERKRAGGARGRAAKEAEEARARDGLRSEHARRWKAGGVVDDFERFSYQASREGRYRQVGLHCRLLARTVLAHVGNTIGHAGAIKCGQGCFSPYAAGAGQR